MLRVKGYTKFLDGCNDYFIGIIVRQHPSHQSFRIGILFDAILLKPVELLAGLAVQIFAVHYEQTLVDIRIVFQIKVEALNEVSVLPLPVVCQI